MKVGTICYATEQGLGRLAYSFFRNGVVTDALVVRHHHHPNRLDWYPGMPVTPIRPFDVNLAQRLIDQVDVMLFFETPFHWPLLDYCKQRKVKSVLMPMHECMPEVLPACPDLILCPSLLDWQGYPCGRYLPVPVEGVPYRKRERAVKFIHNAGHLGLRGRNGTKELLRAIPLLKSSVEIVIRSQDTSILDTDECRSLEGGRVVFELGTIPFERLWTEGDVFVFPEKFNGLSLPLQEAFASGMLVMGSRRYPMTEWLPKDPLIPIEREECARIGGGWKEFREAVVSPEVIAQHIDSWYGRDITNYSEMGLEYSQSNTWEVLKPQYLEVLAP